METLLTHSFDYLAAYDQAKIKKGLRQVELLMAQICLSSQPQHHHHQQVQPRKPYSYVQRKSLTQLGEDPAFLEWFKLQDGFQWNVAMRLIACLEYLSLVYRDQDFEHDSSRTNENLILACLELIQGCLLLHPPSRSLFSREIHMNLLLDLLTPTNTPAMQSVTLLTVVTALLSQPANMRNFEELDGLATVTQLFKLRSTAHDVRLQILEFFYFYLMPETSHEHQQQQSRHEQRDRASSSASNRSSLVRPKLRKRQATSGSSESGSSAATARRSVASGTGSNTGSSVDQTQGDNPVRTTDEKQAMLSRYLNNVQDLVDALKESGPFGVKVY